MKAIKKAVVLILAIALLGSVFVTSLFPGKDEKKESTAIKMENLPGPIDDVTFEQIGEETYAVTITLDNGDILTFDMEVNTPEATASSMSA